MLWAVAVRALLFDVFGTLVDWRSTVLRELQAVGAERRVQADWAVIADGWRARYLPALEAVNAGERPWATLDALHGATLGGVLAEHAVEGLSDADRKRLVAAWHRLDAWPDVRPGLHLLRGRFVLATLSNAHVALLVDLARHDDLRFDAILSAQLARRYKPDPAVYLHAVELLELAPDEAMLVAAHPHDIAGAAACGLRTAFVRRAHEHGPGGPVPTAPEGVDAVADDLLELSAELGA